MLGGEPILTRDGEPLTDGHGHHPYVTTAGSAPSLGKHVLHGLPAAGRRPSSAPSSPSTTWSELYPVTVGVGRRDAAVRPGQRADPELAP